MKLGSLDSFNHTVGIHVFDAYGLINSMFLDEIKKEELHIPAVDISQLILVLQMGELSDWNK